MLLPYIGEKTRYFNFISPNIPPSVKTYVEPFGGMFAIYLSLNQSPKNVIYNDINYLNYNLFYWLSKKYKTFYKKIKDIEATEYLYYEYKSDIYKIINKKPNFDIAIKYAYVLANSSSSINIRNSTFKINNAYYNNFKETIYSDQFISKIKKVKSYCLDYKDIIIKYDSGNTLFYLDPPYNSKEHYYENHNFVDEDHQKLSELLKDIKGKFVISYYNFPKLIEYYPEEEFTWVKNKETRFSKELIIKNF